MVNSFILIKNNLKLKWKRSKKCWNMRSSLFFCMVPDLRWSQSVKCQVQSAKLRVEYQLLIPIFFFKKKRENSSSCLPCLLYPLPEIVHPHAGFVASVGGLTQHRNLEQHLTSRNMRFHGIKCDLTKERSPPCEGSRKTTPPPLSP